MKYLLTLSVLFFLSIYGFSQNCDGLEINRLVMDPLGSGRIMLEVSNESENFFSYPGFRVYNEDDELIAEETVNFFGIAEESIHELVPLVEISPDEPYNLRVELWVNFYESLACNIEVGERVILPTENACVDLFFEAYFGGQEGTAELNFILQIINESEEVVFTENFGLSEEESFHFSEMSDCLGPGCYRLVLTTNDAVISTTGNLILYSDLWTNLPNIEIVQGASVEADFSLWSCGINSTGRIEKNQVSIFPNPVGDSFRFTEPVPSGLINIYDSRGALVDQFMYQKGSEISSSDYPSGLYQLVFVEMDRRFSISFVRE